MPKKPTLEIKKDEKRSKPFFFSTPATCSSTGKRERKFFETKKEATTAREAELVRIANFGISQSTLPSDVRRDAVRSEKLLETHGLTVYEAVSQFVEAKQILDDIGCSLLEAAQSHRESELAKARSCSFRELMSEFIQGKEQEQLSPQYIRQIRRTDTVFSEKFGDVRACDLTTKLLREGLSDFDKKLHSYSGHLRVLKAALNFGIQHDYLLRNPAEKIKHPKQAPKEVKILSISQVKALLKSAVKNDREMTAYFAIGIFAGLRPTELRALEWRDIDFGKDEIFVRPNGANSKERVGRSVPIESNLKKWLKEIQGREGKVIPEFNFRNRFDSIRQKADKILTDSGLKELATLTKGWDQDCIRHTAASNWDVRTGSIAQTSLWLGHNEAVHLKHYHHPVAKKDAKKFWLIDPASVQDPKPD